MFDALAAVLAGRPRWLDVLQRLAYWPQEEDPARAVAMVETLADRLWHPRDRVLTGVVTNQLADGVVRPYLRVVRVVDADFPRLDLHGRMDVLERMCSDAVGVRHLWGFSTRVLFGDPVIALLAARTTGLKFVRISQSRVGVEGARLIATSPAFAGLEELSLHSNALDDEAAALLLASKQLDGVKSVNLYDNQIGDEMVARIRAHLPWKAAKLVLHGQNRAA